MAVLTARRRRGRGRAERERQIESTLIRELVRRDRRVVVRPLTLPSARDDVDQMRPEALTEAPGSLCVR